MKRIITVLLAVCMVVCMMPSMALAEGTATDYSSEASIDTAKTQYNQENNDNFWYIGADAAVDSVYAYAEANSAGKLDLKVVGNGAIKNFGEYNHASRPWHDIRYDISSLNIGSGITKIGVWAFAENDFSGHSELDLSGCTSLREIAFNAFYDTGHFTKIVLPESIEILGNDAFQYCTQVTKVDLSRCSKLKNLGGGTFSHMWSLNSIDISGCSSLINLGSSTLLGTCSLYGMDLTSLNGITEGGNILTCTNEQHLRNGACVVYMNKDTIGDTPAVDVLGTGGACVAVVNGGKIPENAEFEMGKFLNPTKEGYTFAGWYEKDSEGNFKGSNATTPEIGKTYYARWVQASDDGIVTNEEELLAAIASANGVTETKIQIKGKISLTNQIVISNKKISFVGIDKDASIIWNGKKPEGRPEANGEKPMFYAEDHSRLSFENLVFDGNKYSSLIWCSGGSTVSLGSGSTFKNGARSLGGGFNVLPGSEISIDGARIVGCKSTGSAGGAFYMGGGTVIMNSGLIELCSTDNNGGAFGWAWNEGRFVMNGGSITNCSSTYSPAISGGFKDNTKKIVIEMYGGSIYGNTGGGDSNCDSIAAYNAEVKIGGDIKIYSSTEEKAGIFSNTPIQVAKPLKDDALIEVYEDQIRKVVAVGTAEHVLTPADAEHFFNKAPGKCFDYVDEGNGSIVVAEGYQVKYNYNDNTGNYTWDYADENGNTTLKAGPERSGYEFVEWNTSADGTGTSYAEDYAMNNLTADVVLYAQWELKNPTVMVKADKTSVVTGSSVTLTAEVPPIEGVTYEYQWYAGGTDENNEIDGATEKEFTTPALTSDTTYYCKVKAKDGSKESGIVVSNPVKVTVAAAEGNVTITNNKTTATIGEKPFTFTYTASGDVTVASSNTSVATVEKGDNNSVKVTIVGEGETTISVEFEGDHNHAAASDSFTLTVKKAPTISYPTAPADPAKAAKNEAVDAVNSYVKPADYEASEQAEIKEIVDEAKKDIEAAKTAEEVKAIEAAAKAEIDKIETAEEKAIIRKVEGTKFKARSKMSKLHGKKAIKVTWNVPKGMDFDGFEVYRSTKRYSGYGKKPFFTTTKLQYINNKDLKKGKTYYYRVRGFKYVNDEKVYTEYSLKAWRTVK